MTLSVTCYLSLERNQWRRNLAQHYLSECSGNTQVWVWRQCTPQQADKQVGLKCSCVYTICHLCNFIFCSYLLLNESIVTFLYSTYFYELLLEFLKRILRITDDNLTGQKEGKRDPEINELNEWYNDAASNLVEWHFLLFIVFIMCITYECKHS